MVLGPQSQVRAHTLVEFKLMVELVIGIAVGQVAAGRDIEVPDLQVADPDRLGARLAPPAEVRHADRLERHLRRQGHTVPALLAHDQQMGKAHGVEGLFRKLARLALDFLKAEHVHRMFGGETRDLVDAQAHRIYVPRGKGQTH